MTSAPPVTPVPGNKATATLQPGAEYSLSMTAWPLINLDLHFDGAPTWKSEAKDGQKFPRRWLVVKLAGTGQHIPDTLPCRLTCRISKQEVFLGQPLPTWPAFESEVVELKKQGAQWALTVELDAVDAGLLGSGEFQLVVRPSMPHAPEFPVGDPLPFELPLDVACTGLDMGGLAIGDPIALQPRVEQALIDLRGFQLRLGFFEVAGRAEHEQPLPLDSFRWNPEVLQNRRLDRRSWFVGTQYHGPTDHTGAVRSLSCLRSDEAGDYEGEARLELSLDGGETFLAIGIKGFKFIRPMLKSFKVMPERLGDDAQCDAVLYSVPMVARQKLVARGQIATVNFEAVRWNVRVTFWGARPDESVDVHPGGTRRSGGARPPKPTRLLAESLSVIVQAPLAMDGSFEATLSLARLTPEEMARASYPVYFATLCLDPHVTGTDEPAPIQEVMSVDTARFRLVDPDDLSPGNLPGSRGRVHVCSEIDLPAVELRCVPHLAAINPVMVGEVLSFEVHLTGDPEFWKKQSLRLSVAPGDSAESSSPSEVSLALDTPTGRPHVRVGTIGIKKALEIAAAGSEPGVISVRAERTGEEAQSLWLTYDCRPSLANPRWLEREDGSWRLVCDAHGFPTAVEGKKQSRESARFYFFEEVRSKDPNVEGRYHKRLPSEIVYDHRSGTEGLASASGQLMATLKNADWLKQAKGRIHLGVEGPPPDGKVCGLSIAPTSNIVRDNPALSYTHILPFGRCVSPAFRHKVMELAGVFSAVAGNGEAPEDIADSLMVTMALETDCTFWPSVLSGGSTGAVGLIQFIVRSDDAITALHGEAPAQNQTSKAVQNLIDLGFADEPSRIEFTRHELAGMTAEVQLDSVKNFLLPTVKQYKPRGLVDYYLCVFMPAAVAGGAFDEKTAKANPKLCGGDGKITKLSIDAALQKDKKLSGDEGLDADLDDPIYASNPRGMRPRTL